MIRILHVVSIMQAGGIENFIMNLYRNIDREKIQFDFLVHHQKRGFFEDEIEMLGGKVYHFSILDDYDVVKFCKDLERFFQEHREYKIVHGHLSSTAILYLGTAKRNGVPWRISHSHNSGFLHTAKGIAKRCLSRGSKMNANVRLACSTEAGRYLFGNKQFTLIPNAVDVERFAFNSLIRDEMRQTLGVSDNFVIGHIGRFNLQKNHVYLLRIFKSFLNEKPDAKLLLLGDGELREQIFRQIEELGLSDYVVIAGVQKNCEDYYQAMDAFVLPSLFEGLPVTGIEAQYSGLPCFFADTISREAAIVPSVRFIGIKDNDISQWVHELKQITCNRRRCAEDVMTENFDVRHAAKNMAEMYHEMWENSSC